MEFKDRLQGTTSIFTSSSRHLEQSLLEDAYARERIVPEKEFFRSSSFKAQRNALVSNKLVLLIVQLR